MWVLVRSQMGSQFKSKVLEEQVAKIIKEWHAEVRERRKKQEQCLPSPRTSLSAEWSFKSGNPAESSRPKLHEIIYSSNVGEITEVQENIVRDEASSSRGPSRPVMLEMRTLRRV